MIKLNSKKNKRIANNLALEGMSVSKEQQKLILNAINNNEKITNKLIREIAYHGKIWFKRSRRIFVSKYSIRCKRLWSRLSYHISKPHLVSSTEDVVNSK